MPKTKEVGRLTLRAEGQNWNAYYAMTDTMEGAIPLGSIAMGAVSDNPRRKQAFMDLMIDVVSDLIKETTGQKPTWGSPQIAPEHERSGSA